jgi:Sensors of blue-light using FAD
MTAEYAPPPLEKLYNVVYCSHATALMSDRELQNIIATSQANNAKNGITGLLVFGGGMFLQSLEGPRAAVEKLMRELYCDPRHDGVIRLQSLEDLRERLYPAWSMQHVAPAEIREILLDSLSRSRNPRQAQAITLLIELLDSQTMAPLGAAS